MVVNVLVYAVIGISALATHFTGRQGNHIALISVQYNFHSGRVAFGGGYGYRER